MILQLLIQIPLVVLNTLTSFFPHVTVLPLGIDAVLSDGMGYLAFIVNVFPPFLILWQAFVFVLIFKISLKMFSLIPWLRNLI